MCMSLSRTQIFRNQFLKNYPNQVETEFCSGFSFGQLVEKRERELVCVLCVCGYNMNIIHIYTAIGKLLKLL